MVGIVLVSHSLRVVEGIRELIHQLTQGTVPVAIAGGTSDEENPIGTDTAKVILAIEKVRQGDGVLVFMDLGSALLSAESAIDLLPDEQKGQVFLSPAPLVEGAMAAAIQASVGADIETMLKDAESIIHSKAKQLGFEKTGLYDVAQSAKAEMPPSKEKSEEVVIVVPNRLGLHARPAARVVGTLGGYVAKVWLIRGNESANARSLNQIAMMTIPQGETIQFRAVGADAKDALSALVALSDENFGDIDKPDFRLRHTELSEDGIAAAPGTALGPIVWYSPELPKIERKTVADPENEMVRLAEAIAMARIELAHLEHVASGNADSAEEAEFFALHSMLLDDPYITCSAHDFMTESKYNAESAWAETIEKTIERYRTLQNEYARGRAADVLDVGARVLRALTGETFQGPNLTEPSILVASDLGPSDMVELNKEFILGIVTQEGGAMSHVAVFARALKIPAVAGVKNLVESLKNGDILGLNGSTGEVWITPDLAQQKELAALRSQWDEHVQGARSKAVEPAVTRDGKSVRVEVYAHSVESAKVALEAGADGIGIFQTEHLYLNRSSPPTEEEQVVEYTRAAALLSGDPLIVMTADLGGENVVPYMEQAPSERNLCFGKRGVRFSLAHKELFLQQIKALLRAAAEHPIKILLPMVSQLTEVREVHSLINEARAMLKKDSIPCAANVEVGVIIESPSSVILADQLARESDFFVLGGDDLSRYIMVYDVENAVLATEYNKLHPAILRIVRNVITIAHDAGITVSIGGEITGNLQAIMVLVGLGIDSLAVGVSSLEQTKDLIRTLVTTEAHELALQAMDLPDAGSVEALISLHCCTLT